MSVRPIEVQGSFPQSQKAGKLQDQMQQRSQTGQDILAQQHKESEQKKRMHVPESNEAEQTRFHHDEQKERQQEESGQKEHRHQKEETKRQGTHPYKGKFIDLTR